MESSPNRLMMFFHIWADERGVLRSTAFSEHNELVVAANQFMLAVNAHAEYGDSLLMVVWQVGASRIAFIVAQQVGDAAAGQIVNIFTEPLAFFAFMRLQKDAAL